MLGKKADSSISGITFGCVAFLIILNITLLAIAPEYRQGDFDPEKFDIYVNSTEYSDEPWYLDAYNWIKDVATDNIIVAFIGKISQFIDIMTFGDYINEDSISDAETRYWMRIILTSLFQFLPATIIIINVFADWGRGK